MSPANGSRQPRSAEQLRKEAKALAKEDAKRIRTASADRVGTQAPLPAIPIFDREITAAVEESNVTRFPKPETTVEPSRVHEAAPGRVATYAGVSLDYWAAYELLRNEFTGAAEAKTFLDTVYPSRDGTDKFLESEVREALIRTADTHVRNERQLKAVS
jgi:hypothetical protein